MPLPAKMDANATPAPGVSDNPAGRLRVATREVPPGGYWYRILDPPLRVGPFNDSETLWKETNRVLKANGKPTVSFDEVEDQNCQRLPPGYCRQANGRETTHPGALSLSFADVITGTKALAGWFAHGSVPIEETIRRTAICNACPENVPVAGCSGCNTAKLHAVMNAIVVKPLPTDAVLGACSICKCSLKAKTRFKLEDLPALTPEQRANLPEKCWMIADANPQDADPRT